MIKHGSLIISELSVLGVAMVADTVVTVEDNQHIGYYAGFQKLFPIRLIDAGISIWGNLNFGDVDAEVWLPDFINNQVTANMSLLDTANKLEKSLNDLFKRKLIDEHIRMGIHIAGFDKNNGIRGPALYHINNGDYKVGFTAEGIKEVSIEDPNIENPPLREFRIDSELQPKIYEVGEFRRRRNGDIGVFTYLFDQIRPLLENRNRNIDEFIHMFDNIRPLLDSRNRDIDEFIHMFDNIRPILENLQQEGLHFPFPKDLETRGEYLRFWINTVKEVYRLSNFRDQPRKPPVIDHVHIGGPVTVLTISESGIRDFYML